jgi:acyl carrier protein
MDAERHHQILALVVARLAVAAGIDDVDTSDAAVSSFARQDLFAGDLAIQGRAVDSLALTEVLVQVEEELDVALFDDERADEARTLADLVDIMVARTPAEAVDAWLARVARPDL